MFVGHLRRNHQRIFEEEGVGSGLLLPPIFEVP